MKPPRSALRWMLPLVALTLFSFQAFAADFGDRIQFTGVTYDNALGGWLRDVTSLFYDQYTNELYACSPGDHSIIIYDQNLVPRFAFEHYVTDRKNSKRVLGEPHCLAVTRDGDMLVVDGLADYIDVLDFRGEGVDKLWANQLYGDTSLSLRPTAIAKDEADNIYVLVSGDLETILVLNPDLTYKRRIGRKGPDPEEFTSIVGMEVAHGYVFVADLYALPALKMFDTTGHYISGFGGHTVEKNDMTMVSGISVMLDSTGAPLIFSCDELRQTVKIFTQTGEMLSSLGGWGNDLGSFAYPTDIVSGPTNTFFVSEKVGKRIQKFIVK